MESKFYLANSQQVLLGSIEFLKLPDIWIVDTVAKKSHNLKQERWRKRKRIPVPTHGIIGDLILPDK